VKLMLQVCQLFYSTNFEINDGLLVTEIHRENIKGMTIRRDYTKFLDFTGLPVYFVRFNMEAPNGISTDISRTTTLA